MIKFDTVGNGLVSAWEIATEINYWLRVNPAAVNPTPIITPVVEQKYDQDNKPYNEVNFLVLMKYEQE